MRDVWRKINGGKNGKEREASRVQLHQEEKQRATPIGEASLLNVQKTDDEQRRELMVQLSAHEGLQHARANPLKEAKLALEVAGKNHGQS